ncbi:hypothetical protein NBRC116588_06560 [Pyruvatibacter sp. HU-CL02332]
MQQVSDITYSSPLAPVNGAKNGKEHTHSGATGMLTLQGHLVILPAQFGPQNGAWLFWHHADPNRITMAPSAA